MTPRVLVAYTHKLFAEGLTHLLGGRNDCAVSGMVSVAGLTPDTLRRIQAPVNAVVLEGDDGDPATLAATQTLLGWDPTVVLIRVNLGVPTLHVYHYDHSVPAGLDELTEILRNHADRLGADVPAPAAPPGD